MKKRIFWTLFISALTSMLGMGIIVPFLPSFAETLGASGKQIGLIFAGFSLSRFIFLPIVGKLSAIIGRKRLLIFGLLGYSLLSIGYITASSVSQLTVIRLL